MAPFWQDHDIVARTCRGTAEAAAQWAHSRFLFRILDGGPDTNSTGRLSRRTRSGKNSRAAYGQLGRSHARHGGVGLGFELVQILGFVLRLRNNVTLMLR